MEERLNWTRESRAGSGRLRRVRVGAVLAIAIAAGLITWLATRDHGNSHTTVPKGKVVPISERGLETLVDALGRPIHWAGPRAGSRRSRAGAVRDLSPSDPESQSTRHRSPRLLGRASARRRL